MNTLELKNILDSRNTSFKSYSGQYNEELKIAEQDIEFKKSYSHNEIKDKIEQWKKK